MPRTRSKSAVVEPADRGPGDFRRSKTEGNLPAGEEDDEGGLDNSGTSQGRPEPLSIASPGKLADKGELTPEKSTQDDDSSETESNNLAERSRSFKVSAFLHAASDAQLRRSFCNSVLSYPGRSWRAFRARGYIFAHESREINIWDTLLMLFIVYNAVYAPLPLAFGDQVAWSIPNTPINSWVLANILDAVFLFDVIIKARTSFQDHGYEVTDGRKILSKYIRSWLIIDLLSGIP